MPAEPNAAEALALLLRGEIEEGIALYRECLKGAGRLPDSPVGIHLLFLERAGQVKAANRLCDIAVEHGANLALKAGGFGAEPSEAAAEYEALFARGITNSRMVFEYLRVLAELGRWADLRRMLDLARLLRLARLELPDSDGTSGGHAAAVESLLRELEPEAEEQESVQSVRKMRMLRGFSTLQHPAAQALMIAISSKVRDYIAEWRSSDHPLADLVPQHFEIDAWGLISRGEGYNTRHIHPKGWVTGVYYPAAVEAGAGGELLIGRPDGAAGSDEDWGSVRVRPEAGLLVLMPSYYTHWTVPLDRSGRRTSIAFDVLPAKTP
jgi:hypothetical protein